MKLLVGLIVAAVLIASATWFSIRELTTLLRRNRIWPLRAGCLLPCEISRLTNTPTKRRSTPSSSRRRGN